MPPLEIAVGEIYRMRRQHPCGGWEWIVFRTGADIGMECRTCGRRVIVERSRFEARVKARAGTTTGDLQG